jgi:SAM-dependent methyltransferase
MQNADYHSTRLAEDERRSVLWAVLGNYLQKYLPKDAAVLDFGAGYCGFINNIKASRRIAFDQWDGIISHAAPGVETKIGHYSVLADLEEQSLDVVFASNVFEHFEVSELIEVIRVLRRLLKPGGRVIALQPNFRYAYRNYFDDYTHKSIWTHISLPDFMSVNGFKAVAVKAAFLPLTVKSRLPVHPWLIRAYLESPIKPMPGQMLVVTERVV